MGREKPIANKIIEYIRSLPRGWAIKTHGGQFSAGEPDVSGCVNGQAIHLEVKRNPRLDASPLQKTKLRQWSEAGAITGVVSSVDEVREMLKCFETNKS